MSVCTCISTDSSIISCSSLPSPSAPPLPYLLLFCPSPSSPSPPSPLLPSFTPFRFIFLLFSSPSCFLFSLLFLPLSPFHSSSPSLPHLSAVSLFSSNTNAVLMSAFSFEINDHHLTQDTERCFLTEASHPQWVRA